MKKILLMLSFLPFISCAQHSNLKELLESKNSGSVPYISVEQLQMESKNNAPLVILDAREAEEYQVSHLQNAKFVGYKNFSAEKITKQIPDKNTPIVVYCSLGVRSENIGEKLQKAGYTNVKNLYGGIFEWKKKGYLVVDSEEKETEKVHAFNKKWGKWLTNAEKVY
ncbi:rhodanese-like domain-containing protein [Mesonia maritima]|nr:rhodanese-like domain-containing protein [Mesonia maritima]